MTFAHPDCGARKERTERRPGLMIWCQRCRRYIRWDNQHDTGRDCADFHRHRAALSQKAA